MKENNVSLKVVKPLKTHRLFLLISVVLGGGKHEGVVFCNDGRRLGFDGNFILDFDRGWDDVVVIAGCIYCGRDGTHILFVIGGFYPKGLRVSFWELTFFFWRGKGVYGDGILRGCKYFTSDLLFLTFVARDFFTPFSPFVAEPFAGEMLVLPLRGDDFGVVGWPPADFAAIWRILMMRSETARGVGAGWSAAIGD